MPTMPRTNTTASDPRIRELSPALWLELSYVRRGKIVGDDEKLFRQAWLLHGETVLAEWVQRWPGSRPFGWWLAHGTERPILKQPSEGEEEFRRTHSKFNFLHSVVWQGPTVDEWSQLQQPEIEYLQLYGLLTPAECEAIEASDE